MTVYIVASLPRSGTTSLCKMASIANLKPMHVLKEHTLSSAIELGYNFFADTPFYSPFFLIGILQFYKNIKLIYLDRQIDEIKKSFEKTKLNLYFKKYPNFLADINFPYLHDALCYNQLHNYPTFVENHKKYITDIANTYNIEMLMYRFEDGWQPFCNFLGIEKTPSCPIPHLNKSKS